MYNILIVDDEVNILKLMEIWLKRAGFGVVTAVNGEDALAKLKTNDIDLIVADVMMPVMDGFTMVETLRAEGKETPVILATAKESIDDKKSGFNCGADDYMVKPVNVNEMVLRVGALLRRAQMINERRQTIGSTVMDLDSLTVTTENDSFILPQKEFMILYKMSAYPGRIFTRNQLMDEIWGYENDSDTHTVDVHIGRLRDRFRNSKDFKIVTIRGVGYKVVRL